MEAPPGGGVAAERLALLLGIRRRPELGVDDADFQHVARLGAADIDGAGADVDAETAAAADLRVVDVAGAAAGHLLLLLGPVEDAFRAGIALHHQFGVVIRVVSEGLDGDDVAGIDLDLRLEFLGEIAPVDGLVVGREIVVARLVGSLGGRGLGQSGRHEARRAGADGGRAACRDEGALEEVPALYPQCFHHLGPMVFEFRAVLVIPCAHRCPSR